MRQNDQKGNFSVQRLHGVTYLVLKSAVINETFDPKPIAASVRTNTVVINCAVVNRVTSFGIRQWLQMMQEFDERGREVFLVEASPAVVNQLELVSGFAGRGKVLSFYAPYLCNACGSSHLVLLRTDHDREVIVGLRLPTYACRVCSEESHFDEDQEAYLSFFIRQGEFSVPDDVFALLYARLSYSTAADASRAVVNKFIHGDHTFVSARGTLDATLPIRKLVTGLEGTVVVDTSNIVFVEQSGLEAWNEFVDTLLDMRQLQHVFFSGYPAFAFERGRDLGAADPSKVTLHSVTVPYLCASCSAAEWHQIQPGPNSKMRAEKCADCGGQLQPNMTASFKERLMSLPAVKAPRSVTNLIKTAPARIEAERLQGSGIEPEGRNRSNALLIGAIAGLVVVAGGGLTGWYLINRSGGLADEKSAGAGTTNDKNNNSVDNVRPSWISSDQPGAAYCFDTAAKAYCVGVSRFHSDKASALADARDAAFEELTNLIILRASAESSSLRFQRDLYQEQRRKVFELVEEARASGDQSAEFRERLTELAGYRSMVAKSLKASGGAAVPMQQSDSHWEEYERVNSQGTEFLGFANIELSNSALKQLELHYSTPVELAKGSKAVPAFPGLVWSTKKTVEAVLIVSPAGTLKSAGLSPNDFLTHWGESPVSNPNMLRAALEKSADGAPKSFRLDKPE